MDAARLNFSHGTHEDHAGLVQVVREVSERSSRPIAIIADLQGPKVRIGDLPEPVTLDRGDEVIVAAEEAARDGELPVSPTAVGEVLQRGHDILIDDGLIHCAWSRWSAAVPVARSSRAGSSRRTRG